jgi:hypothetical protein
MDFARVAVEAPIARYLQSEIIVMEFNGLRKIEAESSRVSSLPMSSLHQNDNQNYQIRHPEGAYWLGLERRGILPSILG